MTGTPGDIPRERLVAAADRIAAEAGLRLVVLFGSAVRDPSRARDIDLGLLGPGPLDLIDLTNRFIQALAIQAVDLADLRRADPVLLALVARDGVPLYEAESGVFARFASLAVRRFADTRKFRDAQAAFVASAARDAG